MLDAKARNNMYFIEYTVKKPSQEQKHLLSAVALGFNGRYHASTDRYACFALLHVLVHIAKHVGLCLPLHEMLVSFECSTQLVAQHTWCC